MICFRPFARVDRRRRARRLARRAIRPHNRPRCRCGPRFAPRTASSPPAGRSPSRRAAGCSPPAATPIDAGVAVDPRRGSRRDLALRPRRRSADHHLFGARPARRRDQRPGIGAAGGEPGAVRRDARRFPATARSAPPIPAVIDSVAIALAQFGTQSFAEVAAPAIELADGFPMYEFLQPLSRERAQGLRALRLDDADVLPGGARDAGGRDVPPAEPRRHAAGARRRGAEGAAGWRVADRRRFRRRATRSTTARSPNA